MAERLDRYDAIMSLPQPLEDRYARQADVLVAGDMFMYYDRGNETARSVPDVLVSHGVDGRAHGT